MANHRLENCAQLERPKTHINGQWGKDKMGMGKWIAPLEGTAAGKDEQMEREMFVPGLNSGWEGLVQVRTLGYIAPVQQLGISLFIYFLDIQSFSLLN